MPPEIVYGVSNLIKEMRALDADEMEKRIEDMYVDDESDDSEGGEMEDDIN